MYKRLIGCILLVSIIFSMFIPFIPVTLSVGESVWWDENWSFMQEIILPINTSSNIAKFQPIDIRIDFDDLCWAKNEREHSIRVIFQDDEVVKELESQIYSLSYIDNNHISACNIVFLIPKEANGEDRYYVYYDEEEKPAPNYPDRVDIDEEYYSYEPIEGFLFESRYYRIKEEGNIVYAVAYQGKSVDPSTGRKRSICQQVGKLRPGAVHNEPKEGQIAASFAFTYWYKSKEPLIATKLVNKQILVDGNLMVNFAIVSESVDGSLRSTVVYKYYYCPTEDKRIHAHVKHEVLKYPLPASGQKDVTYVILDSGVFRSSTIRFLNFGKIFPYLHIYSQEERILTHELNLYPDKYVLRIPKAQDQDLGSHAWASVDEGSSGKAHAIIFSSTDIVKSGADERQGIEIQQDEGKSVEGIPGLDISWSRILISRNTYEPGEGIDLELPKDFVAEFDAEFFSTENGGYRKVEEEAIFYQSLVNFKPIKEDNITNDKENGEKSCSLTAFIRRVPSFPMGAILSTVTGKKVPYISVELYRDESCISSETGVRLPMKRIPDSLRLIEIIKQLPDIFDFKSLSFFKKVSFEDLSPGIYLIKVWRENSLFQDRREFIGFKIIDLQKDTETHIFCGSEGNICAAVLDQNGEGIKDVHMYLIKDNITITDGQSNTAGNVVLQAPCGFRDRYTLKMVYKGFRIFEEQIRLRYITSLIPLEKTASFEIHDFTVNILDANGSAPVFDVDMTLASDEMEYPFLIQGEDISDGKYLFEDLYPATYDLTIQYKSFIAEETITIPDMKVFNVMIYDLKVLVHDTWGLPAGVKLDTVLSSNGLKKPVLIVAEINSDEEYLFFDLYPTNYSLKLQYGEYTLTENVQIPVKNDGILSLVFPAEYNLTATFLDNRGTPLGKGLINISRDGKEVKYTINENGQISTLLPPGVYNCEVYHNGQLVGERKVNVISTKNLAIVVDVEPIFPVIISVSSVIFLIISGIFMLRRKDFVSFLKILAVALAVVAVVSPWWEIYASDSGVETSTKMFLIPSNLVTITSTSDVIAGEHALLDERFEFSMNLLPLLIAFACICIILSILLKKLGKKKYSFISVLFGTLSLGGALIVFSYAMNELAKIAVGGFIGNGNLDVNIPGEGIYETLTSYWGPSTGFFLNLFSIIILILIISFYVGKKLFNRNR